MDSEKHDAHNMPVTPPVNAAHKKMAVNDASALAQADVGIPLVQAQTWL